MTPRTAKRPQSWLLSRTGRTMHTSPAVLSAAAMSPAGGNSRTPIAFGTACGIAPLGSCTPVTRSLPTSGGPSQRARTPARMCVPLSHRNDRIWAGSARTMPSATAFSSRAAPSRRRDRCA